MTTAITILDVSAPDGTLGAFSPNGLDMSANARRDAAGTVTDTDVAGAKAMSAAHEHGCGNAQPIELRRVPGAGLRVRDGHRRTIMCQRAGVPVFGFIAGADGDEQAELRGRLITQWFSNHHNEKPQRSDDVRLMLTLFDTAGMTEAGIARALGIKRPVVKSSLAVARSPLASQAVDQWSWLDLEQSAILADFAGDDDAIQELIRAAKNGHFEGCLTRLRDSREERAARRAFEEQVTAAGYLIYGERYRGVPWTMVLSDLRTPEGEPITPGEHAACEGAAVTIEQDWGWDPGAEEAYRKAHDLGPGDEVDDGDFDGDETQMPEGYRWRWQIAEHLCNNPGEYGHVNIHAGSEPAQATAQELIGKRARESAERKRVLAQNKLWRAATLDRRRHVTKFLKAKSLPKTLEEPVTRYRAAAIAQQETVPLAGGHLVAAQLLGTGGQDHESRDQLVALIAAATAGRVKVIELAIILGAQEHGCSGQDGKDAMTWRQAEDGWFRPGKDRRVRYLEWIVAHTGYKPSEIEQGVIDAGQPGYRERKRAEAAALRASPAGTAPAAASVDTGNGIGIIPDAESGMTPEDLPEAGDIGEEED